MKLKIAIAVSMLAVAQSAQAQDTFHWLVAPAANGPEARKFYLPEGTHVRLRTITQISSRDNKPGDRIYLEVAENVSFRGQTVIPVGAPVIGEVSELQHNGHFGKKGLVGLRLIEVETPNGPVQIGGEQAGKGKDQTALSVGTILLVSTLGYFIHGTSAVIAPGTPVDGYLRGDLRFAWHPTPDAERLGMGERAQPDMVSRLGVRDAAAQPGFSGSN